MEKLEGREPFLNPEIGLFMQVFLKISTKKYIGQNKKVSDLNLANLFIIHHNYFCYQSNPILNVLDALPAEISAAKMGYASLYMREK